MAYLLFSGLSYYPGGGWKDYKGSFATVEDAKAQASFGDDDWYHVVLDGEIVAEGLVKTLSEPKEKVVVSFPHTRERAREVYKVLHDIGVLLDCSGYVGADYTMGCEVSQYQRERFICLMQHDPVVRLESRTVIQSKSELRQRRLAQMAGKSCYSFNCSTNSMMAMEMSRGDGGDSENALRVLHRAPQETLFAWCHENGVKFTLDPPFVDIDTDNPPDKLLLVKLRWF